jgi:hypothetical protein
MTGNKIFGTILLILGVALILLGLYNAYSVFQGKTVLPQVFQDYSIESVDNTQNEMQALLDTQLEKVIPAGSLLKMLNLIAWSIFTGIIFMAGSKIAMIGVRLMK